MGIIFFGFVMSSCVNTLFFGRTSSTIPFRLLRTKTKMTGTHQSSSRNIPSYATSHSPVSFKTGLNAERFDHKLSVQKRTAQNLVERIFSGQCFTLGLYYYLTVFTHKPFRTFRH